MATFLAQTGDRIKSWWSNPYLAPLTEPLRIIGAAAYTPTAPFLEGIIRGYKDEYGTNKDKPLPLRIFKEWTRDSAPTSTDFTATVGAGIACLLAGVGTAIAASAAAFPIVGVVFTTIAAAAVTFVGFPLAVMTALGIGGATVGALWSPVSFVKGISKGVKHFQSQKAQNFAVQATPALKAATPDAKQTAGKIFADISALPPDLQGPVLKSLGEQFAASGTGQAEQIIKSLDAMPDAERAAVVKDLRMRLSATFDAATTAEAKDSVVLQDNTATMQPLKLKLKLRA